MAILPPKTQLKTTAFPVKRILVSVIANVIVIAIVVIVIFVTQMDAKRAIIMKSNNLSY